MRKFYFILISGLIFISRTTYPVELADSKVKPVLDPAFNDTYAAKNRSLGYLVKYGDTAWSLARKFRADDRLTIKQTILAMYRINPRAFIHSNINGLKAGYLLTLPVIEQIKAINQSDADTQYQQHMSAWQGYRLSRIVSPADTSDVKIDTGHTLKKQPQSVEIQNSVKPDTELNSSNTTVNRNSYLPQVEIATTLYYRIVEDNAYLKNTLFTLSELEYSFNNTQLELGISYQNYDDEKLSINNLEITHFTENADYKIGRFVEQAGVLDYVSTLNTFNTPRLHLYNEANKNVRSVPAWMLRLNWYPDDEKTIGFITQRYDKAARDYLLDSSIRFYLNSVVPFQLTNTGDQNLDLIGQQILVPVTKNQANHDISNYINSKFPNESASLQNTTFGINYLNNQDGYTYGFLWLNGYSKLPLLTIDEGFLDAVANLDNNDRWIFIQDYLAQEDKEPIESVDYFRYNQLGLYYETSVDQFGVRSELSYQNRYALLNEMTPQASFGLGIDHKGSIYNNIELQYIYFENPNLSFYYFIWMSQFDPVRMGTLRLQFKNIISYATYEKNSLTANLARLSLIYKQLNLNLEYLAYSRDEITPNTLSMLINLKF